MSTRLFQYPVTELQNHAVLFGQGNEVFRRHFTEQRVGPADQRFGADQALGFQAELGLIVQAQFIALQCTTQFVFKGNAFAGLGCEVTGIGLDPIAPLGLGPIHRRISIADQ
ncbi:hypothetical protein D9M71_772690 [compost metagenome]